MKLLQKLEDLINRLLIHLGDKLWSWVVRLTPTLMKQWIARLISWKNQFIIWCKSLPQLAKQKLVELKQWALSLLGIDFKKHIKSTSKYMSDAYNKHSSKSSILAMAAFLWAPFRAFANWATTLPPTQFILLFTSTTASFMAIFGMVVSGGRILNADQSGRTPASVEVVDEYNRPEYYKRDAKEAVFNNFRLPVYETGPAQLRALVFDFTVLASNRATRQWLEKHEFQLRDHLILTLEQIDVEFPLTDEGREVIRSKLKDEVNIFLQENNVKDGSAENVKVVYILGH